MEVLILFLCLVGVLGLLNLAVVRWGVNSRDITGDWQPRLKDGRDYYH